MLTTVVVVMIGVLSTMIYGQQTCQLTQADVLGPYYLPNAPKSSEQLCENTPANDRLILTGQVVDYDSKCTRAIPYVKLDLWQVISFESRTKFLSFKDFFYFNRPTSMESIRQVKTNPIGFVEVFFTQTQMGNSV